MILKGKTAIVTGGGTGIGAAIAKRFVAEGAKVCIVGRRENVLEQVISSLPKGTAVKCPGDVTQPGDVERILETALAFGQTVHVLVNNAGIGTAGSIIGADLEEWRKTLEINLIAPFMLMRAVIPHMIKNGGGAIVNVSSLASLRSIPEGSAYCTSKAGLNMLTKQAALDFGGQNIRCNVICPGFVYSEMTEGRFGPIAGEFHTDLSTYMDSVFRNIPTRAPGAPDDIAGICSFLASDDASYINGTVIPVDGGLSVMDPFPLCVEDAGLKFKEE